MDKFKISQLRDYFLKTNDTGVSYKDLSKEDLLSLAILSIFDKKGETIQGSQYSYERPDGIIDENELNEAYEWLVSIVETMEPEIVK